MHTGIRYQGYIQESAIRDEYRNPLSWMHTGIRYQGYIQESAIRDTYRNPLSGMHTGMFFTRRGNWGHIITYVALHIDTDII